ncbi:hypothetical protein OAA43_00850 [bacterium]|nr:hypothetical protein [bacterium]
MSTNLEINPELPLNQFKKELPKKKYNDILKLRLLEAEFDNTMDQYQRTYQTYLGYTKQQVQYEWRDRYPVQVSNLSAYIDKRFRGNITKDECFADCANDDNCKYVLWSDSGRGAGRNCAPNKCKKYTTGGGSMISSDGIVESNPMCAADLFVDEVLAEIADPFLGWLAFPFLEDEFPTETNYKYHGWEKPEWEVWDNTSLRYKSDSQWVGLENTDSAIKCNQIASKSAKGPFSLTMHNGNTCQGRVVTGNGAGPLKSQNGYTVSLPPGGQTGMIVASRISTVNQLKVLNSKLLTLMNQIYTLASAIYPKGIGFKKQSKYEAERILKKNKRLMADREAIHKLSGNLSDIEGQNESLKLQHDANHLLYLGMSVLLVGVAGITYKVVTSKST